MSLFVFIYKQINHYLDFKGTLLLNASFIEQNNHQKIEHTNFYRGEHTVDNTRETFHVRKKIDIFIKCHFLWVHIIVSLKKNPS